MDSNSGTLSLSLSLSPEAVVLPLPLDLKFAFIYIAAPSSVPRPRYPRSISADKGTEIKTGTKRQHSLNLDNQSNLAGIQHHTPDIENAGYQTRQQTPGSSHEKEKPETPVTHSDQEVSGRN